MKTILVIEDDKNIRESIVDLLETSNFTAIGAPNGAEGIRVSDGSDMQEIRVNIINPSNEATKFI
jgi:DNA-binding response OmpR family regulator